MKKIRYKVFDLAGEESKEATLNNFFLEIPALIMYGVIAPFEVVNQILKLGNAGGGMDNFSYQNAIIRGYRELAADGEVSNGIDIIVNELIYTTNNDVFKILIDEENQKIADKINESFKRVLGLLNIHENIFNIGRQMYIDGQLNIALGYKNNDLTKGIITATILEPEDLYFDKKSALWTYTEAEETTFENDYASEPND